MQSKQKITLYIPPELHRKLKIKAAVDVESMSALVEKAISFYMQFPEKVDEIRSSTHGNTHQVHICPECDTPMVMRSGEMVSLVSQAGGEIIDIPNSAEEPREPVKPVVLLG